MNQQNMKHWLSDPGAMTIVNLHEVSEGIRRKGLALYVKREDIPNIVGRAHEHHLHNVETSFICVE